MENINLYDYHLPEHLIATTPKNKRGDSKLLVLKASDTSPVHDYFSNITNYLIPGDVLVINNTKVRKARIKAFKPTGGHVEILLSKPLPSGFSALINRKIPANTRLRLSDKYFVTVIGPLEEPGSYHIESDFDLGQFAENHGEMPLPPYMKRKANPKDEIAYQTIFAKELGAVASPTAGLHFTKELLESLNKKDIQIVETTLHVGPGTFLPIRTENILEHKMHKEIFFMDDKASKTLNQAKKDKRRIIPVGSTAMRVIEQVMHNALENNHDEFFACSGVTELFIKPGYEFLASSGIITNFHVPRSTLLVLVSAIIGRDNVLRAYEEAISREYKFFSYGDACFFELRK
jgi:S-adenosylmethionine:tRNA ribosyltransferase-isomerase